MPADYFASDLNPAAIDIAQMGVADERQCFWKRWCKIHYTYETGKSILDNGRNSLDCRICRLFIHEDHQNTSEKLLTCNAAQCVTETGNTLHIGKFCTWLSRLRAFPSLLYSTSLPISHSPRTHPKSFQICILRATILYNCVMTTHVSSFGND